MNIDDIKLKRTVGTIVQMFEKQRELMKKYDGIEAKNGAHVPEPPYHLDNRVVQYRLKDLFWRVTEELAEAMEAVERGRDWEMLFQWRDIWDQEAKIRHYFEELADAVHFLVEASIISEVSPAAVDKVFDHPVSPQPTSFPVYHWYIVYHLGLAANCLKNKPWKQTAVPTDDSKYRSHLLDAWSWIQRLWAELGCDRADMLNLYERKWGVNKWRQDTKY